MDEITVPSVPALQAQEAPPREAPAERRTVASFGSGHSDYRAIANPSVASRSLLEIDLAVMDRAWRKYQSIKDRDAVYIYLASVFDIVMRWRGLNCALNKSRAALRLRANPPQMKAEPFGIVIFCTAVCSRMRARAAAQSTCYGHSLAHSFSSIATAEIIRQQMPE
jgi:hypothetical protein